MPGQLAAAAAAFFGGDAARVSFAGSGATFNNAGTVSGGSDRLVRRRWRVIHWERGDIQQCRDG